MKHNVNVSVLAAASNIVSNIYIFQGIVSKSDIKVLWQH